MLLFYIFISTGIAITSFGLGPPSEERIIESIPNPLTNPSLCNRQGLDYSWLCDPKGLLNERESNIIEQYLLRFRDTTQHICPNGKPQFYQLVVVTLDTLGPSVDLKSVGDALLNRWGLGYCDDGLLLLLAVQDKMASLSWGENANAGTANKPVLTAYFENRLIYFIHSAFSKNKPTPRVIQDSIELIRRQLPLWNYTGYSVSVILSWTALFVTFSIYITTMILTHRWYGKSVERCAANAPLDHFSNDSGVLLEGESENNL